MKGLWRHIKPYKKEIYKTIVCTMVLASLTALGPFILGWLYDRSNSFTGEFLSASIFVLYAIFTVRDYFDTRVSQSKEGISLDCEVDFRCRINDHLNRVSSRFYQKNDIGEINDKIDRAANYMYYLINEVIFLVLPNATLSIAVFLLLLKVNYLFSLIMLLMLAIHTVFTVSNSAQKIEWEQDRRDKSNKFASYIQDMRANSSSVKSLGIEDAVGQEYSKSGNDIKLSNRIFLRKIFPKEFLQKNILTLGTIAAYGLFLFLAKEGRISTGDIIIVLSYTAMLIGPFSSLSRQYGMIRRAMVHINAANEILDELEEPSEVGCDISERIKREIGAITATNLCFMPSEGNETLTNVNINIPAGPGLFALVGESGSGKTTLWKILLRYFSPNFGKISFGGISVSDIKISSLRKYILSVERTVLFGKSIRYNVAVGYPNATEDEIKDALRAVRLDYLIDDLDRIVNSDKTSHGENQRILIARAYLNKKPGVFIFDEPTQALDSINSRAIMDLLKTLSLNNKVIMITHDLEYIIEANRIFVMEKGMKVEEGTHKELMALKGKYAEHFLQQSYSNHAAQAQIIAAV